MPSIYGKTLKTYVQYLHLRVPARPPLIPLRIPAHAVCLKKMQNSIR